MTDGRKCLHCDETKSSLKRQGITMCGIEGGYEYRELIEEWPRHRWRDWTDAELDRWGIRPEAFDKHRRTSEMTYKMPSMRLEVRFSIRLGREKREATEMHDTFESQGALIESVPQPRYVGFEPVETVAP